MQTTRKKDSTIVFDCDTDGCDTILETGVTHPDAAVAFLRASQWGEATHPETGVSQHHCPRHAGHA